MTHRKSRRAYIHRGHFWLIVTFVVLRAVEGFGYYSCLGASRRTLLAAIINANILTIALLVAIWFRQGWARAALVTLIVIWVALGITFPGYLEEVFGDKFVIVMIVSCAGYVAALVFLIVPQSVNKLISRELG
jgi:hypothetical protein